MVVRCLPPAVGQVRHQAVTRSLRQLGSSRLLPQVHLYDADSWNHYTLVVEGPNNHGCFND